MFSSLRRPAVAHVMACVVLSGGGLLACGGPAQQVVCVASSVRDAVAEVFSEEPERVALATGSSGALRAAIENGAPCEVFVSASSLEVDLLQRRGLVVESSELFGNQLALVVPLRSASVTGEGEAGKPLQVFNGVGRIAIGNPAVVPAGRYARAWLESVGLLPSVDAQLVFTGNARATLAAVESGSVAAGIVYTTDAAISSRVVVVKVIEEPAGGFGDVGPIRYVVALLGDARNPPAQRARELFGSLQSARARGIFEAAGFLVAIEENTESSSTSLDREPKRKLRKG